MESQQTPWTAFGTRGSVRRLLRVHHTSNPRPYHQLQQQPGTTACVCTCKSKNRRGQKSPTEWGWQECPEGFVPLQTTLPPAPEQLLQVIRCNCKADWSTLRCSCKKHNIECTPACGSCRGSGCTNTLQMQCDDNEDDVIMMMTVVMMPSDGNDDSTQLDM